ncbi:unnamed protein product [Eruca vesicaria subsp. sativa]|uniref:Glabrous enhancer-binding protein-like DBD domain-containing protein n=1 Tax=Eruca vesicaria subsp. sativa TaxID=29727 RepID=A0ABC8IZM2_ERUVS|nr:unnamed protein product [Eruca vesicaria subsp. sativa]
MANNLKHPLEDPPSLSPSAGEKEIEFVSSDEEDHQHTIISSEEDEPEDPRPRSSSETQLSHWKRLSTNARSKRAKKTYTQGKKIGSDLRRLFSEKDEIVLLQSIIDSKGKNPLEDNRLLYESMKGSFSVDVTLGQFREKLRTTKKKYTTKEMKGEKAFALNPHQQKCFQLSKAIWGAEGIACESANGKAKESKRRVTNKLDLVSSRNGNAQDGRKREDMEKSPHGVTKSDWDESSFFLGMDFLKEKWTKLPTESKKTQLEKMKKLHANELECKKYEETLKVLKDQCTQDKVELLNEVTSLIIAAD